MELLDVYETLLSAFGPRGWWPMEGGFVPKEWEVCLGAILTQNTNWKNVEKALGNLRTEKINNLEKITEIKNQKLAELIRPSGYYNQKAKRLKDFSGFVEKSGGVENFLKNIERDDLLGMKGIGPETADSILLYACGKPFFVVDAYTRRVFSRTGMIKRNLNYEEIRDYFEKSLPKDPGIYNEFHALIVELGKNFCKKRPLCGECPLRKKCGMSMLHEK